MKRKLPPPAPPPRLAYRVYELPHLLGHSASKVSDLIARGEIPVRRLGTRRLIVLHADLVAFLERLPRHAVREGPDRLARAIAGHAEAARRRATERAQPEVGTPAPRRRLVLIRDGEPPEDGGAP
jgi:hypothetical protein